MITHEYRVQRVHIDSSYKWTLQASVTGRDSWVQVTNMEAKVPLFHHKTDALQAASELQNRQQNRKPKGFMQFIADWIETVLDRLEIEPEEVEELTIKFPGGLNIVSICIANKEVFVWDVWDCPFAYWTNDYDEIAREYAVL